jgi:hypothetical protein
MDTYEFDKYVATKETLKEVINKYGVAIIPNVLDENECINMQNEMWNYLEHITSNWLIPIDRNDQITWRQITKIIDTNLLFELFNIGHSQMAWDVRQNPKVVDIFAHYWDVKRNELHASFDGASIYFPPEVVKSNYFFEEVSKWYHIDKNYSNDDIELLQSWITGYDVFDGDATLAFLETSNNYYDNFINLFDVKKNKNLNEEELKFYLDRCDEKLIKCPKGSLVLWSNKTVHCGMPPFYTRENDNIRCVSYLCYTPKIYCNKENLKKKKKAFNDLDTTTHVPYEIKLKPVLSDELYQQYNITKINKPIITSLGYSLAGF